jgi:hypothetical protein
MGVVPPSEDIPATAGDGVAHVAVRRYRVQRDFDEIDRSEFREQAFATIRAYFESSAAEINTIEDLRGRFVSHPPTSFGCTIVNRSRSRGTAHITVHSVSGGIGLGDIYYSFAENAQPNTANGGFNVEADEYELYLTAMMMGFSGDHDRLTPEGAAELLWAEFLQQAGVSYD